MSGRLYHTPAHVIHSWVLAQTGITDPSAGSAWPGFINNTKPNFENLVSFNDTAPIVLGRIHPTKLLVEHYGFQLYVRGVSQTVAFEKASELQDVLLRTCLRQSVTIDARQYLIHNINSTSGLIPVGKRTDEDTNFIYTGNFSAPISLP